ncbi:hypothetical protein EIP86_007719 [Pleurotus ostreatoroseus]|nr:hypothetical protein EIP86_007719 [Pleurotus ostreatoroseus]
MSVSRILLDGGVLEGGGQLLRNAVALSVLLSKPIAVNNIRENRKPPGLRPQHAAGLRLAAQLCSGQLTGGEPKSKSMKFTPGPINLSQTYLADPGTAGSTTLLLQVALPCLLFAPFDSRSPTELILRGGTNATQAPQIDYAQHVLLPFLHKHFGINAALDIHKRGYYPRGGGEVRVSVPSFVGPLRPLTLTERGVVTSIHGRARAVQKAAHSRLVASGIEPDIINIDAVRERNEDVVGAGSGVVLWAETDKGCRIAGSTIGAKGKDSSTVGEQAADELIRNLNEAGCVDEYLQDQLIIFLALAAGKSVIRIGPSTLHTRTAIWVAEQLTDAKFHVEEQEDGSTLLYCDGICYTSAKAAEAVSSIQEHTSQDST